MVARRDCDVRRRVALSVDTHQLWHPSSGVEIKFEYVSGHLPAKLKKLEIRNLRQSGYNVVQFEVSFCIHGTRQR